MTTVAPTVVGGGGGGGGGGDDGGGGGGGGGVFVIKVSGGNPLHCHETGTIEPDAVKRVDQTRPPLGVAGGCRLFPGQRL